MNKNTNYTEDILVIENSIDQGKQNTLEKIITRHEFPWFFYTGTILPSDVEYQNDCVIQRGINPPQFSHFMSVERSQYIDFVAPILNCLANVFQTNIQILKLKFNLLTKTNKKTHHWPHADIDNYSDRIMTGLYYVNDSDGPTSVFKQFAPKKSDKLTKLVNIDPQKGKLVIFDSRRFHASSSPTAAETRIVLNIVFRIPENEQ